MATWTGKKVAVLYGGLSTERDVSLRTGKACADALVAKGYDVINDFDHIGRITDVAFPNPTLHAVAPLDGRTYHVPFEGR